MLRLTVANDRDYFSVLHAYLYKDISSYERKEKYIIGSFIILLSPVKPVHA